MHRLNKKDAELYIRQNYAESSPQDGNVLTYNVIEKIYHTSAGDTEAIEKLCIQYLNDPVKKQKKGLRYLIYKYSGHIIKVTRVRRSIYFIIFFILLFVVYNFIKPIEIKKMSDNKYKKQIFKIKLPENRKTKVSLDKDILIGLKELSASSKTVVDEELQVEHGIIDDYSELKKAQSVNLEPTAQIHKEKDHNSTVATKKSSTATSIENNIESNEKKKGFKKDINWLVSQHSDKYVLQLVSAVQRRTIANYLAFFGNSNESIIEFTAFIDGQKRYILLYGPFDNPDLANAQIEKLPQKARQIKPWVRTIKSIKELVE